MKSKPKRDVTGKQFGHLTALEYVGQDNHRHSIWKCLCVCGKEIDVSVTKLSARKQTSCGCQHIVVTKPNMRFDRLVTLYRVRNTTWLCKCDCGKEIKTTSGKLLRGEIKSCGCMVGHVLKGRGEDLTGKVVGELTVQTSVGKDKHGHTIWHVVCSCGNELNVTASALGPKGTRSCGCKRIDNREKHGGWRGTGEISGSSWNQIYRGAINRRLEFSITIEFAWKLFLSQNRKCNLTGLDLKFSKTKATQSETTASLDRIDSSKGYTEDNIQWVHKKINLMKMQHSQEEFVYFCNLVTKHIGGQDDKQ